VFTRFICTLTFIIYLAVPVAAAPGDWPMWRHDSTLTGFQPLPAAMTNAPRVIAEYFLGTSHGLRIPADLYNTGNKREVIVVERARLFAYDKRGKRIWESAPEGYVPEKVEWVEDLDGDGNNEVIAVAGHMGLTRQAYLILDGRTGKKRAAIDINTGDFSWRGHCGAYLPGTKGKQIFIVTSCRQSEQGAFPAASNGELSLWSFDGGKTQRHWTWTPPEYVLFYPSVMVADLNADGRFHAVVDSWSHVWQIDLATGTPLSHTTWDPQGANQRQYGWNELVDVDGDAKLDFVNISLTKHVDVLRNVNGKLQLGWTKGWPDPVTTEAHAIHAPSDPVVDLDGDGKMELITSFFEGVTEKRWKLWIWDAATGEQKVELNDLVALASVPVAGNAATNGRVLLCARSSKVGYDPAEAYEALQLRQNTLEKVWSATNAAFVMQTVESNDRRAVYFSAINVQFSRTEDLDDDGRLEFFTKPIGKTAADDKLQAWGLNKDSKIVAKKGTPTPAPVIGKKLPALQGTTVPHLLAADLDGRGPNEILLYDNSNVSVLRLDKKKLRSIEKIPSTEVPVVCDLLGDGQPKLLTGGRHADGNLWIKARGADRQTLWEFTFPESSGCGQYSDRPHYFLVGHFTGGKHLDVFTYSTKPSARTYVLDGRTGKMVWERVNTPGVERFYQPLGGRASAWDYNRDGADDVLMCIPDFYVVANGRTGEPLVGPADIQPLLNWWAAYGSPAPLRNSADPMIYLGGVYSSRATISLDGKRGLWREYLSTERWPLRAGNAGFNEGLLPPTGNRGWRSAQMEADGTLVCFDVETGKHAWKMPIPTATAGIITGDIDGNGTAELLFGGQDGFLYAIRDAGDRGEILWRKEFTGPVTTAVLADVDSDKQSEIIVSVGDGFVYVLDR
jgi:outer membrane protein assembly factor BamB